MNKNLPESELFDKATISIKISCLMIQRQLKNTQSTVCFEFLPSRTVREQISVDLGQSFCNTLL